MSSLYDAHILNMSNLDHSIYITFTISSLLEFPGDLLAIWGVDAIGRRWSCALSLLLSGITMLICGLLQGENYRFCQFSELSGEILTSKIFYEGQGFATYATFVSLGDFFLFLMSNKVV